MSSRAKPYNCDDKSAFVSLALGISRRQSMDWLTFAVDMACAVALVLAVNVPIAIVMLFLAGK